MFDFDKPEDGSADRFVDDKAAWHHYPAGKIRHHWWWLLHNLVAHPLIGIAPIKVSFDFHDWTSRRMHRR